jgi:hypothetical protein
MPKKEAVALPVFSAEEIAAFRADRPDWCRERSDEQVGVILAVYRHFTNMGGPIGVNVGSAWRDHITITYAPSVNGRAVDVFTMSFGERDAYAAPQRHYFGSTKRAWGIGEYSGAGWSKVKRHFQKPQSFLEVALSYTPERLAAIGNGILERRAREAKARADQDARQRIEDAAPELLEALKDIVQQSETLALPADLADAIRVFGKAAIAKAEGGVK